MVSPTEAGIPVYRHAHIPTFLRSYRQLKEAGLRPACASQPDGAWQRVRNESRPEWLWLYDVRQARPYICTTKHASSGRRLSKPLEGAK